MSQEPVPATLGCIICGCPEMDEMQDQRSVILAEPLVVLVCMNCGYVMHFAIRPGGPQIGYTDAEPDQAPS
jgi:hypothetical protein